mgnify:CR=1 FL=1
MRLNLLHDSDEDLLDQLGGLMGLGWTASVLGYLSSVIGYGNGLISRLVSEPQSLLYVGGSCFLLTLGLDRLHGRVVAKRASEDAREE